MVEGEAIGSREFSCESEILIKVAAEIDVARLSMVRGYCELRKLGG